MTQRSGRCLCGAVEFTVTGEPLAVRICWCRDCQHIAGNGTVNMLVRTEQLQVSGSTAEYVRTAASGNLSTRMFCPGCGVHLFSRSSATPQFRGVRIGNLDDPSSIRPTINIWTASAPSWACMDPAMDAASGQPAPPAAVAPPG